MVPPRGNDEESAFERRWYERVEKFITEVQHLRVDMASFKSLALELKSERVELRKDHDKIVAGSALAKVGKWLLGIAQAAIIFAVTYDAQTKSALRQDINDLQAMVNNRTFAPADWQVMKDTIQQDHANRVAEQAAFEEDRQALAALKKDVGELKEKVGKIRPIINFHAAPSSMTFRQESQVQYPNAPGTIKTYPKNGSILRGGPYNK